MADLQKSATILPGYTPAGGSALGKLGDSARSHRHRYTHHPPQPVRRSNRRSAAPRPVADRNPRKAARHHTGTRPKLYRQGLFRHRGGGRSDGCTLCRRKRPPLNVVLRPSHADADVDGQMPDVRRYGNAVPALSRSDVAAFFAVRLDHSLAVVVILRGFLSDSSVAGAGCSTGGRRIAFFRSRLHHGYSGRSWNTAMAARMVTSRRMVALLRLTRPVVVEQHPP